MNHALAFQGSCLPQAIVTVEGVILEANGSFQSLLRCPFYLPGRNLNEFVVGTRQETGAAWKEVIGHLRANEGCLTKRLQYQRRDGTRIWVDLYFSRVREQDSSNLLVQVVDVTKQQMMAEALEQRRMDAEHFAHVVSHDLREPLPGIAGYATLLQRRTPLDAQGQKWVNDILEGVAKLEQRLEDLVAFSRASKGTLNGTFSLGAAVEEAERSLVRSIKESGAVIQLQNSPMLKGDRSMIASVLQNLLSNSIKYRKEDTTPKVTISAEPQGDMYLIRVSDNGLGFDMQFRDKVFELFQRLYTVKTYPGTGIGLAIAKKIVDRHGGRIWVESKPGEGSVFYLTLPAAAPPCDSESTS